MGCPLIDGLIVNDGAIFHADEWSEDAFERFFEWVDKDNPNEAPGNAMPEDLRKSPLRKRKALRALNDNDPLSRRNLSIEIREASLDLAKR